MVYTVSESDQEKENPVTVCIAAICEGNTILCAADRMLTTTDVEFEPPRAKVLTITSAIRLLTAGDSALHAELYQVVSKEVSKRIDKEPDKWLNVKDVAILYAEAYTSAKLRRAEAALLAPLGLNRDTFIAQQRLMAPDVVVSLTRRMQDFRAGDTHAIVAGIDETGAHVFIVKYGDISCRDSIGFASIGRGSRHADSEFMFAKHTRHSTISEALWRLFSAKKRSEVAPGVGEDTDMVKIGPKLGDWVELYQRTIEDMNEIYHGVVEKETAIQIEAHEKLKQYIDEAAKRAEGHEQKSDGPAENNGEVGGP